MLFLVKWGWAKRFGRDGFRPSTCKAIWAGQALGSAKLTFRGFNVTTTWWWCGMCISDVLVLGRKREVATKLPLPTIHFTADRPPLAGRGQTTERQQSSQKASAAAPFTPSHGRHGPPLCPHVALQVDARLQCAAQAEPRTGRPRKGTPGPDLWRCSSAGWWESIF